MALLCVKEIPMDAAPGTPLATFSLTTSQQHIKFTSPNGRWAGRKLQLRASQDWSYALSEGGVETPVLANEPFNLPVHGPELNLFVKATTTAGILYPLSVTEG